MPGPRGELHALARVLAAVGVKVTLSQQELESRLWAAANSLRGPVDPSDFKAYIFPLLFYKRVTDAWDDEHARAVADFGTDVTADIEADYHRFQLPEGCHYIVLMGGRSGIEDAHRLPRGS